MFLSPVLAIGEAKKSALSVVQLFLDVDCEYQYQYQDRASVSGFNVSLAENSMHLSHQRRLSRLIIAMLAASIISFLPATAMGASGAEGDAHRLVGLISYVGADYAGAVRDGEVINQFEYEEQLTFLTDARELVGHTGETSAKVSEALRRLEVLVRQKAASTEVQDAARHANRAVIEHYDITLSPKTRPDLKRGALLYEQKCVSCHGETGNGDTPISRALSPNASDFTDPEVLRVLSPYRAFNATTFGVNGTAMVGFTELNERQRWDLAFYVLALGHGGTTVANVPKIELPDGFDLSLDTLATTSDAELTEKLVAAGVTPSMTATLIAQLRTAPPFVDVSQQHGSFEVAQGHVMVARKAWKSGDTTLARKELLSGYLEGFEQVETRLGSVDSNLVRQVEGKFMDLRSGLKSNDDARVARDFDELDQLLLQSAQTLDSASMDGWATAVASGVIILREGLEVILLLALLLGIIRRLGLIEAKKYVHLGWIFAVGAGVGTWIVAQKLITISGIGRELIEGVVGILAALVLFSVSYWFMSKIHGEKWTRFIKVKLEERVKSGNLWAIAGLSFLAVYRELLEVILFFQAIALESNTGATPILGGILVACVALAAVAYLIFKVGARLPLKPFFAISGAALYGLAMMMMGSGLQALIEAGILPGMPAPGLELRWLGIYPQVITLAAQGFMALLALIWIVNATLQRKASSN